MALPGAEAAAPGPKQGDATRSPHMDLHGAPLSVRPEPLAGTAARTIALPAVPFRLRGRCRPARFPLWGSPAHDVGMERNRGPSNP